MGSPSKKTVEFYDKDVEKDLRFDYHAPSSSTPLETGLNSDKEFDSVCEKFENLIGDFYDIFTDEYKKNIDDGDARYLPRMHVYDHSINMASAQEEEEKARKLDEAARKRDEVAMNELIKQANESCPEDEIIFGGWLYNKIHPQRPLHLFAEKTWSGDFFNKYPNDIEESASFVQTAKKKNGIKSAVVYSCKLLDEPFGHLGYLLAWSDSIDKDGNIIRKTYGYCDLLEKFENFNDAKWDIVKKDLDKASSSFSYIDELFIRTSMKAQIVANVIYAEFYR